MQEQEFERLGGMETRKVDVRVVAATSESRADGQGRAVPQGPVLPAERVSVSMPPGNGGRGHSLLVENFLEKYGYKIGKRGLRVAP